MTKREDYIRYFKYLDRLRSSGLTNMLGAGKYLEDAYRLSNNQARTVLLAWIDSFDDESDVNERVDSVLKE